MKKLCISLCLSLIIFTLGLSPLQARTIDLKMAWHFGPVGPTANTLVEFSKRVKEESNGQIIIKTFPSSTLVASGDQYEAVMDGITDIVFNAVNDEPTAWPLNQVFIQPAIGAPIGNNSSKFYNETLESIPELAQEMSDVKILFMYNAGAETNLHTTKKLVRSPADVKGMKLIGVGSFVEYLKAIGASPLYLTPNDFYTSLERGVAEGVIVPYSVLDVVGGSEVTKYHLSLDLAAPRFQMIMNLDKWNKLSSEHKALFDRLNKWAVEDILKSNSAEDERIIAKLKKKGDIVTVPTPAEFKLWQDAGIPMLEKWIRETEAMGKPATKVFEKVKAIADKYR